jgi:hypothetical protein
MISDKAKAAVLDKCCQKVDCLARGEVIDLEGAPDLHQSTSPVTETDSEVAGLIERLENWNHGCKTMVVSETIDTLRRLSQKVANYRGYAQTGQQRMAELRGALEFLFNTKWKSVDKDNMEFEGRVTCYQLDRARAVLADTSTDRTSK